MSTSSQAKQKIITDKAELIEWFMQGCTPAEGLRIGVEHEKPPFYLKDKAPVPYASKGRRPGLRKLFEALASKCGWKRGFEKDKVVELRKDGVGWTLEPGGQMETGGAPLKNVHDIAQETDRVITECVELANKMGIGLLALGYHPTKRSEDMPMMPRSRYEAWREYAHEHHVAQGLDGLFCTSSAQVNLGYSSEEDMVKKLRVALSLQPIVIALFANSPFCEGAPSGYQSYRSHILRNYMNGRYGYMLPIAFEENFGFETFVEYALDMPLLGLYRDGAFVNVEGATFRDFMDKGLPGLDGKATIADWENHLNTIWPEVRLRRFLEMRGADNGPPEMIKALAAFWAGILYDPQSLDAACDMVCHWNQADREYLRDVVPKYGLQAPFMYGQSSVQELAQNALALAEAGLKRRAVLDAEGQDESVYLKPLHEIAASGMTQAQKLLYKYDHEWDRDISRVFEEKSYMPPRSRSVSKHSKPPEP